ncbi:MAG: Chaperone SurA [Deltaproteobacteria bacterium]|nr:Chaperone SurA [Deltaproteobacteria bacterium]MBM2837390.1 Chaperone SurA [Deltaproteobacteria bacterium]
MFRHTLLILIIAASLSVAVDAEVVERIVAVVNDKVITMSDLKEEMAIRRQFGVSADKAEALSYLIEREIVSAEAGRLGLTITMDDVTKEIVRFEETFLSRSEFALFLETYELDLKDLSRKFASSIVVDKVREQKEGTSAGRYDKWLSEAKKKADIRILRVDGQ